jgi:hypothetical protein
MCATASVKAGSLVKTTTPGIFKKNNRYVVVFRDTSGRQRKRFARTMAEARDLKALLTADVRRGEYRTLSKVSFEEYAREWIEQYGGRTKRSGGRSSIPAASMRSISAFPLRSRDVMESAASRPKRYSDGPAVCLGSKTVRLSKLVGVRDASAEASRGASSGFIPFG